MADEKTLEVKEEHLKMFLEGKRLNEAKMRTDREYKKLWDECKNSFGKIALLGDSVEK